MVATAVIGSAVVGGAAQFAGASSAASAQKDAANQANATSREFFGVSKDELQPFIDQGHSAASKVSQLEGLDGSSPGDIQATLAGLPGYQFANQQGLKSVQNSATARGLGVSGASQKAAANYSTGLANQFYNNYLSGIQGTENTGENAANALAGYATTTGQNIGQTQYAAGKAAAAADISQGNAIGNIAGSVPQGLIASSLLQNLGNSGSGQGGTGPSIYDQNNALYSQLSSPSLSGYGQIG